MAEDFFFFLNNLFIRFMQSPPSQGHDRDTKDATQLDDNSDEGGPQLERVCRRRVRLPIL